MRAQWVHRMLLPAGPNEALWRATPLYWANQALGVTTAADNILTADKPLSTSPLVVSAQDRDVPPQWQACFKSYGQVFVSQDTSEAPATALEVLAQPLFHNIRLAGPHGEPLATWTDCVSGRWQRWAANDIDRVEDLYDVHGTTCTPLTLDELQERADTRATLSGLPGATEDSIVAIRPDRQEKDDQQVPGYALPLWLARVVTKATAHGCNVQWYEGNYTAGRVRLGRCDHVPRASMVTVVRHCAPEANLTLTAAERRRVENALAHAKEWRHPAGPLIQADLDVLTQALRAARWTHFLAAHMVGPTADDWYVDPTTSHDRLPNEVYSTVDGKHGQMLKWTRRGTGYAAGARSVRRQASMMTKITVMDGKTGDQATHHTRGPALRVMGFGGCQLQMTAAGAQYTVAAGRRRLQGGISGTVIAPIMDTAAEYAIAETTVRHAIAMVNAGRWLPAAKDLWWRYVARSHARSYGDTIRPCECCKENDEVVTAWSVRHTVSDCPSWGLLWRWCQQACRDTGAPISPTVTRQEWFLFGAGIDVSSAKAATAVAIWGAALHAMQCLMYRLREDGETFTPAAAVNAARHRLSAAASADYWWIENQHEWLRDGGARAHPTRTTTRAAWDQKWSGLQRRTPHKVAGHEAADGGATSDGWLHQEEQRTCRRNSIA